jgi:uncharacterized membrane protein YhiD involved in acid resistance
MDLNELLALFLTPSATYQSITVDRVILSLIISFTIGLFLFFVYRKTFTGVIYTRTFNISMVLTSLIVTLIVIPISSNVALSLGMVGALSIVRFRTAVKDPKDIVFMFWAIAVGIINGAGLYMVAIIGSPIIGLFLFLLGRMNFHSTTPFLLAVHYSGEAESAVQNALPKNKLKSRTVTHDGVELMVEVQVSQTDAPKVDQLLKIKGVKDASLVSYNADVS